MEDYSEIDGRLKAILLSRDLHEYPYSAKLYADDADKIEEWCKINCIAKYKIFVGYYSHYVFFDSEIDCTTYKLTWY